MSRKDLFPRSLLHHVCAGTIRMVVSRWHGTRQGWNVALSLYSSRIRDGCRASSISTLSSSFSFTLAQTHSFYMAAHGSADEAKRSLGSAVVSPRVRGRILRSRQMTCFIVTLMMESEAYRQPSSPSVELDRWVCRVVRDGSRLRPWRPAAVNVYPLRSPSCRGSARAGDGVAFIITCQRVAV